MFDLGKTIPFEIAVGMNGRVWLRGRSVKENICLGTKIIKYFQLELILFYSFLKDDLVFNSSF